MSQLSKNKTQMPSQAPMTQSLPSNASSTETDSFGLQGETLLGTVFNIFVDMVGLNKKPNIQIVPQTNAQYGSALGFSFRLNDAIATLKAANPNHAQDNIVSATANDLKQMLASPVTKSQHKYIAKILLRNFNALAHHEKTRQGIVSYITEDTLRHLATMNGQVGSITDEGMITYRAMTSPSGLPVEDICHVLQEMSGKGWQRLITKDLLKTYILQPGLLPEERNVAMVVYNHFSVICHEDLIHELDIIDMSDIQAVARRSDAENHVLVTREGLTGVSLSLEERKQIERWLDKANLDENGCPINDNVSREQALLGYLDRYDRILSCYPQKPWLR